MVYGRINIMSWFEMQGKPYFAIFRKSESQSGNFVFSNKDKENETMETAKAFFDQCLKILGSGDFFIYCNSDNKPSSKGRSETFFSLSLNESAPAPAQQPLAAFAGIGAVSIDQVNEMAEKKFTELMTKKELEDLRKKNAELEKQNRMLNTRATEPMNKFLQGLSPYIGNIVEALGVKKVAAALPVSGVKPDDKPQDNKIQENPEENEQEAAQLAVSEFLEALAELYPDNWQEILEKLTNAIKTDPDKINMALKFL